LTYEDNVNAIKRRLWLETDRAYRTAAERLIRIKTNTQVKVAAEDDSDDFSTEDVAVAQEPLPKLKFNEEEWAQRIRKLSGRFQSYPSVLTSHVSVSAQTDSRFLVNTEGSRVQHGRGFARVTISASAKASDGTDLGTFETFEAVDPEGLPDDKILLAAIDHVANDLSHLLKAPDAEPFVGPAIFSGRAAGVFFHEIFGHRVEGHRQKNEDEGQTFAKKIGEPVMPTFVSVYDDPTLSRIGGVDLNGFYRYDDEAVTAQRATLVDKGVLTGFLLSRSPTRGFHESNGHGRRQEGRAVVSRQGNLVVQTSAVVPIEELRRRLRDEAKRQGKQYGLLFRDISGGFTNTTRTGPQSFKVLPILVYRIWADGRPDELVRGVDLVGTPLSSLSRILASGDDYQTFNGYCGAESGFVPVSATSPSLLVQQIEIERRDKGSDKPPILPAPPSAPTGGKP
jgi:predicted Zn-dependent protease